MIELPDGTTIKSFTMEEFECKCGCGNNAMDYDFLSILDDAREYAGVPFVITSGYRCAKHNKDVGGKRLSAHTLGLAADISALSDAIRYKILDGLLSAGFTRIGIGSNFIHVDDDSTKNERRLWTYG